MGLYPLCQFHIGNDGNTFDSFLVKRFKPGDRVPCANGDKRDFLIANDLRYVIFIIILQHQVDTVDFLRTGDIFKTADMGLYFIRGKST